MAVAVYVVNTVYARPEFVLAHIGQGIDGFFAAVGAFPLAGYICGGVRCVNQRVVVFRPFAALYFQRFLLNLFHRSDEAVELGLAFAFGGFDHQCTGHGEGHGRGVYDIHSPRVPTEAEVEHLLRKAISVVPLERLWVNPDCGLKTRGWAETIEQLRVMMAVTNKLRSEFAAK